MTSPLPIVRDLRDAANGSFRPGPRGDYGICDEAADVVICLARFPGIWEAVEKKMAINRGRTWRLTGEGTGYHVSEAA